jgi:hypothetical protein
LTQTTRNIIRRGEEAVRRLLEECRPTHLLYGRSPRKVAQINRTGKWLLNAIAALKGELETSSSRKPKDDSY